MRLMFIILILSILFFPTIGCSSSTQEPVTPPIIHPEAGSLPETQLWGLYNISLDPATGEVEVVPLRSEELELNVLKFLEEPGPGVNLKVSGLKLTPPKAECNVGLRHPFAGMSIYTGFSVRGIVLTNGSWTGFSNTDIVMSGTDELRLENADGYTRWMNPFEFPYDGTILNYWPGKLGDPNGDSYKSTLNPYKLFADGLSNSPDNMDLNESRKSWFSAGSINWRKYQMDFGSQEFFVFQYAVVASWQMPSKIPPMGPDDFPPGTVAGEPWRVETVELANDLYYDKNTGEQGGELALQVLVRDFENADQDKVFIEAPGVFPREEMSLVNQSGGHLTFEMTVADIDLTSADTFDVLVAAVATDGEGYDGRLPGEELATYMLHEVKVSDHAPQQPGWPFYDDFENYDYIWTPYGGEWWGKAEGYMDAKGGGTCYEEDNGSDAENPNVSYVSSPGIAVPVSDKDLVITINHTIDVDPPEELGHFAWDMCYARVDGVQIFPTSGPPYEDNYYPWTYDPIKCWTTYYPMMESKFNLGTAYNGSTIHVEFVLDTYDYILNCDPPFFGWLIDDILVDFAE